MRTEDEKALASLLLALGVIIALFFPAVAEFFAPYLLPALFFVMVFSLLPFARLPAQQLTRLHPVVISLVFWQQFVLPAAVLIVGRFLGVDQQLLFFVLVTVTSGSLFASPTLIQLMGLEQRLAVQSVVVSTLAAPVSIYLIFGALHGANLNLDFVSFGERLLVFLAVPIGIFVVLRRRIHSWSDERKDRVDAVGRWGSVLSLIVFCFALEAGVSDAITRDPEKMTRYLGIAIGVAVAVGLTTRIVMSRFGATAASTAMVLSSFRNVGLTYGLLGQVGGTELSIYVGICQIPMFFSPLLFGLFFGRTDAADTAAPKAEEGTNLSQDNNPPEDRHDITPPDKTPGNKTIVARFGGRTTAQGSGLQGMPAGAVPSGNVAVAYDMGKQPMSYHSTALAVAEDQYIAEEIAIDEDIAQDDARKLLDRLQDHYDRAADDVETITRVQSDDRRAATYTGAFLAIAIAGVVGIWHANKYFFPMLFDQSLIEEVAVAHTEGRNFGVFDLNINIRDLRNATIARMEKTPEAVVLGASHWQEAHVDLVKGKEFYNSHVHRDYYEDMMAVTEMWVRHDKLPKEMIITIRDNLLTPIPDRTDFLWLPGIKYYRQFAERIGFEPHSTWDTLPVQTWRELVSLPLLWEQASRDLTAPIHPHATDERHFDTLDTLLPGGSILWSGEHQRLFTQERARQEALAFADMKRNNPPKIDPKGVEHMEALFDFLTEKGVKITLAHPQFNPIFWEAVQGSPYMDGLKKVEDLTKAWAERYGFGMIGGFAPESVGCTADQYIDAEHGNPTCLGLLLSQFDVPKFDFTLRGTLD